MLLLITFFMLSIFQYSKGTDWSFFLKGSTTIFNISKVTFLAIQAQTMTFYNTLTVHLWNF